MGNVYGLFSYKVGADHNVFNNNNISGSYVVNSTKEVTAIKSLPLPDSDQYGPKITYDPNAVIGVGTLGTMVYGGTFNKGDVAVKRITIDKLKSGKRQENILQKLKLQHENILSISCTQESEKFHLLAMERCNFNLAYLVDPKNKELKEEINVKDILMQTATGVQYLHDNQIIHCNIQPKNILLKKCGNIWKVKISGFGISEDNLAIHDWTAPEYSKPSDIKQLGQVTYFMLTSGKFPTNGVIRLSDFDKTDASTLALAEDLIKKMLNFDPNARPTAREFQCHALFWKPKHFLDVLAKIITQSEANLTEFKNILNVDSDKVIKYCWKKLCNETPFLNDFKETRHKNVSGQYIYDLLKYIRNKHTHITSQPQEMQVFFGKTDQEFLNFWTNKFPELILHVFQKIPLLRINPDYL